MAKALKLRICDLLAEFLANTLVVLSPLKAARTVASALLKSLLYGCNDFFILIKSNSWFHTKLLFNLVIRAFSLAYLL